MHGFGHAAGGGGASGHANFQSMFRPLDLAHGLEFADLYRLDGLRRLDTLFLADLDRRGCGAGRAACRGRARRARCPRAPRPKSALLIALGAAPRGLPRGAVRHRSRSARRCAARHHALAPLYAVKRLFVQRKRDERRTSPRRPRRFDGRALRAELEALYAAQPLERARLRARGRAPGARTRPRNAAALDLALRYAAWAPHSRPARSGIAPACCSRRRTSSIRITWCRSRPSRAHGVDDAAAARRTTCAGARASR